MSVAAERGLTLRAAGEADVPFLLALRDTTMTHHFVASGVNVTPEEHRERVLYRYECAQIVERAGQPMGILKVTRDGREWQLVQIQLAPELQGQGIGRALIEELCNEARAAGASLSLSVLHANPARRLYESLGFRVVEVGDHSFNMLLDPSRGP